MSSSFSCSGSPAADVGDVEHWLSAADLLTYLDIAPSMTVADIGAGTGSYALRISDRLGSDGVVFAVEWRSWLVDQLHARLSGAQAPANIRFIPGRAADTHLPNSSCDLVILADMWHELEHHDAVLEEARRILRVGGRLAILNWRPDALCPPGPPVEHRVSMKTTICAVEIRSWSLVKCVEIGTHGYLVVFEITDESVQS